MPGVCGTQKKVLGLMKLKLRVIVSHCMGGILRNRRFQFSGKQESL